MNRCVAALLSMPALVGAALVDFPSAACAHQFPARPIRLVVGNLPGRCDRRDCAHDRTAASAPASAQSIVIEHRLVNGTISAEVVAGASPTAMSFSTPTTACW